MLYDQWIEEGKRDTVKRALRFVVKEGLKEPHHFYITFRTQFPGVSLPDFLRKKYPEEMTIVLHDAFWELCVQEDFFSVELLFDKQKYTLRIPFKALVNFLDPGVEFGIQFQWKLCAPLPTMDNVIYLDRFRQN